MEGEDGDVTKTMIVNEFRTSNISNFINGFGISIDSIITAVGNGKRSLGNVCSGDCNGDYHAFAAEPISNFVNKHPVFKILALSFLLLIGFSLIVEGFGKEIPKGYIYFAMAFSLLVDIIQMKTTKNLNLYIFTNITKKKNSILIKMFYKTKAFRKILNAFFMNLKFLILFFR